MAAAPTQPGWLAVAFLHLSKDETCRVPVCDTLPQNVLGHCRDLRDGKEGDAEASKGRFSGKTPEYSCCKGHQEALLGMLELTKPGSPAAGLLRVAEASAYPSTGKPRVPSTGGRVGSCLEYSGRFTASLRYPGARPVRSRDEWPLSCQTCRWSPGKGRVKWSRSGFDTRSSIGARISLLRDLAKSIQLLSFIDINRICVFDVILVPSASRVL